MIMEYIKNTLDFHIEKPTAITFGKFDGRHRGHELLLERLLEQGNTRGLQTVVFTFDIPPEKKTKQAEGRQITTNGEKGFLFAQAGVDYLIECPFTEEIKCMEPLQFIEWITKALSVRFMVVGQDFHFGHNRRGDYRMLQKFEEIYGYKTLVLDKIKEDGRDISSTFVREEIVKGNIEKANHLLGYPYFIQGTVVHGNAIGRRMGIPTINMGIPAEKLLPPFGVYVTRTIIGEHWYQSISNIGRKPTVGEDYPVGSETYILDFCQDLYDKEITIQLLSFLRPERRFASMDELQSQISSDIARAKNYYAAQQTAVLPNF